VKEQIHPHRRLSKRQEERLDFWILRQESLGYAPSHSQIRACVMGLLRQQGEHPDLGRNWVIKPENTVNVDEGGIMTGFGKRLPLFLVSA